MMKRPTRFLAASGAAAALLLASACASAFTGETVAVKQADGTNRYFIVPTAPPESQLYADFMIARFASLTNDPRTASERYGRLVEARAWDGDLTERAIFFALLTGDFEDALGAAMQAAPEAVEDGSLARLVLGVDALRRGKTGEIGTLLDDGPFGAYNNLIAKGMLAWARLDNDGLDAARRTLAEGLTGDALMDGVTFYTAAMLELAAGHDDEALVTFEATWAAGTRLAVATEAHARLLASRGDTDRAMVLIDSFMRDVGPNPSLKRLAAEIASGEPVAMRRPTLREGAALAVYAPSAALAASVDTDVSGVYFTLALALDPNLQVARTLFGDALDKAERLDEAADMLAEVPQSSEFYANARAQLAWVYRRLGKDALAISTAQDALKAVPDRDLKVQLGDLLRSLGRLEEADRVFSEVLVSDGADGRGADWRILFARATVRDALGDWPGAETDLRAALAVNPDSAEALNYLGYSLVDRGLDLTNAFEMIRRAVTLDPQAGHIVDSLGWAYYRLGQYDSAADVLERAAALSPGNPTITDHLGDAYWQVGRYVEADYQWQRVLTLKPDAALAAQVRAKLSGEATPDGAGRRMASGGDPAEPQR